MTTHKCPAPGCTVQVHYNQLACKPHWWALPEDIRIRVWRSWRSSDGAEHTAALKSAISYLEARYGGPL